MGRYFFLHNIMRIAVRRTPEYRPNLEKRIWDGVRFQFEIALRQKDTVPNGKITFGTVCCLTNSTPLYRPNSRNRLWDGILIFIPTCLSA